MAIRIKNDSNGRTIVVKNQDDMFNLKNTGKTFDFDNKHNNDKDTLATYDLSRFNDKDIEDYINSFSFDANTSTDTSLDAPLNPQHDVYYDFDKDNPNQNIDQENQFDINDDSEFSEEESENDFSMDDEEPENDNPDMQGQIRSVTGAALVYKRQNQDGTYNELWVYTVGKDVKSEYAIRRAILSGTEIDPNTQESDDGSQKANTSTVGNVQFIQITGLAQ